MYMYLYNMSMLLECIWSLWDCKHLAGNAPDTQL